MSHLSEHDVEIVTLPETPEGYAANAEYYYQLFIHHHALATKYSAKYTFYKGMEEQYYDIQG